MALSKGCSSLISLQPLMKWITTLSKKYAYPVQEYIYVTLIDRHLFVLTRQFNRKTDTVIYSDACSASDSL